MNKKEIIDEVYEKGKKWEGLLMACYANEVFTRKEVYNLVKEHHESETAVNTGIDHLLKPVGGTKAFISHIGKHKTNNNYLYTITAYGEQWLYDRFPVQTYEMGTMLDEGRSEDYEPAYFMTTKEPPKVPKKDSFQQAIEDECMRIESMLLDKNRRYGNSSLNPTGVFTSVKRESKIEARIDDKLARIKNFASKNEKHCIDYEDAIDDLIGYLILYRIALRE